jgi:U3 small nucleolar RNA-associated protein 21
MVTCHGNNTTEAYLWNVKNGAIGEKKLYRPKKFGSVKCVAMSVCGNFALLGRSNGDIEKWNTQSGLFKGNFISKKHAHSGAVTGVVVDNFNAKVVSGGWDGKLKV